MKLKQLTQQRSKYLDLFINEQTKLPFEFADFQVEMFNTIANRYPRFNHIITPTQVGKSLIIALGIIVSACLGGYKWAIVAPSNKKTMIIMNYIIQHLFDNTLFYSQLEIETSMEKLKRERTKTRLVFKGGGEIFVVSADSKNKKNAGQALMGFGCFEKNQKVLTENGYIKIGDLYKNKPKVKIACYDEKEEKVKWHYPLNYQKNKKGKRKMVKVNVSGKTIFCTENHRIFTKNKGWTKAIELKKGDVVLRY